MKVVIFCGGLGVRMREVSEEIPKPMLRIGDRPILWHIMKYYAHYGVRDFILCLGYRAITVKKFFLDYREMESNNFVLRREVFDHLDGGRELVPDALNRLRAEDKLVAWQYEGFWAAMDTPKEMFWLNELYSTGGAKWAKWEGRA